MKITIPQKQKLWKSDKYQCKISTEAQIMWDYKDTVINCTVMMLI